MKRIIGSYKGNKPGKLFITLTGLHGNETSGRLALKRVFERLSKVESDFRGFFIGLYGNVKAIKENRRYIDKDFNRMWDPEMVETIKMTDESHLDVHEEREMKELINMLEKLTDNTPPDDVLILDLHNTSSSKGVFVYTFDKETNRQVASVLKIPIIMGVEKSLKGTAIEYFHHKEYVSFAFEGGEIGAESSIRMHEAGIWLLLNAFGCIEKKDIPGYDQLNEFLLKASNGFPELAELSYTHKINPDDDFRMLPGFENYQLIKKGELLAHDRNGPIYAPGSGYMLMPLYQKQGDEGFFIIKEID